MLENGGILTQNDFYENSFLKEKVLIHSKTQSPAIHVYTRDDVRTMLT